MMRRILASSFLGTMIEFYDFLLYATAAAVVFNKIFFISMSPAMATFASFATLAAGYVARPLGAVIFGHFGDRLGRKGVLVVSMLAMGICTTVIGLLPTAAQIGVLAPVILVSIRIIQGLAIGGEWGGAMLIALEHAPGGKRGFAASFANLGAPAGAILGAIAMALATTLPDEQFFSWGWRVPFLFSIVLVFIGMVVRLKVTESPLFQEFEKEAETRRLPIMDVLTNYPKNLSLGILVGMSQLMIAGIATVWAVNFAIEHGADKTGVLSAKAFAAAVMLIMTLISAKLCDRYGRKPIIAVGIAAAMIFAYPMLLLVQTGTVANFTIAVMVAQGIQGIILGPLAAFLAELFPTRVRFTGASVAFQGASTIGAGLTPMVAAAIVLATGGSIVTLGAVWIGALAISLLALVFAPEGRKLELQEIK